MAASKMNDQKRDQIETLRGKRGWSYNRIGLKLGLSQGAVSWHCLINGIERPGAVPLPKPYQGAMVSVRGGREVRRFTIADDQRLLQMEGEGKTFTQIARALGRRSNSIRGRLATLARRDERMMAMKEAA